MNHNISSLIANVSYTLICFLLTVTSVYGGQTQATNPKAIFIIVDGVPADVLESTATPNLDEISGVGGYSRAFVGGIKGEESESLTVSAVGYNSLITGTWANKHNVWNNDVTDPNYD